MGLGGRTLALLVLTLPLVGCGLLPSSVSGPKRANAAGPVVVLAGGIHAGREWQYVAYRSERNGLCEEIIMGGPSIGSCGNTVPPGAGLGGFGVSSDSNWPTFVYGPVSVEVAEVEVETKFDGRRTAADIIDGPAELEGPRRFFLALLPSGTQSVKVTAFDEDREILAEAEIVPPQ